MSRKVRHDLRSTGVPLPYAGACGKRSSRRGPADFSAFRRLKPLERLEDTNVEAKLKVLIRHLVTSFPETSILSREIAGRYHLFIIVPYSGGPEKAIQVDRAVLREPALSEDEFALRLDRLYLPAILQGCVRYDLGPWPSEVSGGTSRQSCSQKPQHHVLLPNNCSDARGPIPYGPYAPAAFASAGHSTPG